MNYKKIFKLVVIVGILAGLSTSMANAAFLSIGSKGGNVEDLQVFLIERGFDIPAISNGLASPGYFGDQTQRALIEYQLSKSLPTTGSIDTNSLKSGLTLGAVSSPDISSPYFSFGDVRFWGYSTTMVANSSTTCNFQSPAKITKLVEATANFTNIASTSIPVIGWSVGGWATTTTLGSQQLISGGTGTLLASSTANTFIVPANTFISVKIPGGAIAGTTVPAGTCKAVLMEVQ